MQLAFGSAAILAERDPKSQAANLEKLIQQGLKEVTMHEVGHTLGLRHNFKASKVLEPEGHERHREGQGLPGRFGDGLQPDEHRAQGLEAGRLLQHDARSL